MTSGLTISSVRELDEYALDESLVNLELHRGLAVLREKVVPERRERAAPA